MPFLSSLKDDNPPLFKAHLLKFTWCVREGFASGCASYNTWCDAPNAACTNGQSPEARYNALDYDSVDAAVEAKFAEWSIG